MTVTETLKRLKAEQVAALELVKNLNDAIRALEALTHLAGIEAERKPRKVKRKPRKLKRAARAEPVTGQTRVAGDDYTPDRRREILTSLISTSEVGLTVGQLRKQTPKMGGVERSNALQALKISGVIQRVSNTWCSKRMLEQD